MNPGLVARGLAGLVLPAVMALSASWRRPAKAAVDAHPSAVAKARARRPRRSELRNAVGDRTLLESFDLRKCSFAGMALAGADLSRLDLREALFRSACLIDVSFIGSVLDYADLSRSDLRGADFSGASLIETDLGSTDLRGADLTTARHLLVANLRRARFDPTTRWPSGIDPIAAGAERV